MSKKILVTDQVHPYLVESLAEEGISCDVRPDIIQEETKTEFIGYMNE